MNPPLKITFLGTGTSSGIPMIACNCAVCTSTDKKDNRLRASILLQSSTTTIVVDTTPDFRYQMLRQKIKKIDAVLFTHPHKDHIAGLDDIRAFNFFQQSSIDIYANTLTQEALKKEFSYIFAEKRYPGIPQIDLCTIDSHPFTIGDIAIIPILVWHLHMPVLGFRFGDFTYITDANKIDEGERKKITGSKIMVLNALRKENHLSHFSLPQAIETIQQLKVPEAYLIHLSHQMGKHQDIKKNLPAGIHLSYDGLELMC